MMGLFSQFDLSSMTNMVWLGLFSFMTIHAMSLYFIPSRTSMLISGFYSFIINMIKGLLSKVSTSSKLMFVSVFMFILIMNFPSLSPYIFSFSSHISLSLSLGLLFWFTFMLMGYGFNSIPNITHIVPLNTPKVLMSFMVLVESISLLIRPITLSVRLMANITAGHLILGLMASNYFISLNYISQVAMFFLEVLVSFIQAYVFMMLLTLYFQENI